MTFDEQIKLRSVEEEDLRNRYKLFQMYLGDLSFEVARIISIEFENRGLKVGVVTTTGRHRKINSVHKAVFVFCK